MEKPAESPMCSFSFSGIRNYLIYLVVLIAFMLVSTCSFSPLVSAILLSFTLLLISIIFLFTINKRKPLEEVHEVKEETLEEFVEVEEQEEEEEEENEVVTPKETQEVEVSETQDYIVQPQDLSETESMDLSSTSEDSDADWLFKIPECSKDDSISDDDSLIEIALQDGHYISPKEDYKSILSPQKLPYFLPESIFRQEGLMELLAEINEMNEEDNLIEIDLSIGSIKCCSRLEIEA